MKKVLFHRHQPLKAGWINVYPVKGRPWRLVYGDLDPAERPCPKGNRRRHRAAYRIRVIPKFHLPGDPGGKVA